MGFKKSLGIASVVGSMFLSSCTYNIHKANLSYGNRKGLNFSFDLTAKPGRKVSYKIMNEHFPEYNIDQIDTLRGYAFPKKLNTKLNHLRYVLGSRSTGDESKYIYFSKNGLIYSNGKHAMIMKNDSNNFSKEDVLNTIKDIMYEDDNVATEHGFDQTVYQLNLKK